LCDIYSEASTVQQARQPFLSGERWYICHTEETMIWQKPKQKPVGQQWRQRYLTSTWRRLKDLTDRELFRP
jgi:hypothetical protein